MITRIVRMEFQADKVDQFLEIFHESKSQIRHFPGVHHLELHRDLNQPNVFYTYSHWEDEAALNAYRKSELFGGVWPRTKALFAEKPQAFSLLRQTTVE